MKQWRYGIILIIGLALLLAACARSAPTPTPTPVPPTPTKPAPTKAVATPTQAPTPTEEKAVQPVSVDTLLAEALEAVEAGDLTTATNRLRSALTATTDPGQRSQIEDILNDLTQGNVEEAKEQLSALVTSQPHPEGELAFTGAAEEGYEIYLQVGCAQCHGERGEGGVGPPLAGHTREAIIRQVRNPVGSMPAFPPDRLSDEDLEKIVAFIEALGAGEEHAHAPEELTTWEAHLLLALLSLQDEAVDDAKHHIQHALNSVTDTETRESIAQILDLLNANEIHDAEHDLQRFVGETVPEKENAIQQIHLELADTAVEQGDVQEARHQLQHLLEVTRGDEKATVEEILEYVEQGDLETADTHLHELMGGETHGH